MRPRDFAELGLYRLASLSVRALPLATLQGLGRRVAERVAGRGQASRIALMNLRLAFPELTEEERRRLARESFVHVAWNVIDFLRAPRWSEAEIKRRVSFEGLEFLMPHMSSGRGAFVLTLHLGNFELANLAAPLYGIPLTRAHSA
jgi:KDO2-lipid IV(A) lauroyltransferase